MGRLDTDAKMTMSYLLQTGQSKSEVAKLLNVTEGTIRYHAKRTAAGTADGRSHQQSKAAYFADPIADWHSQHGGTVVSCPKLYTWLRNEHSFKGSLRSVQRYCRSISHTDFKLRIHSTQLNNNTDYFSFIRVGRSHRIRRSTKVNSTVISLQLPNSHYSQQKHQAEQWVALLRSDRLSLPLFDDPQLSQTLIEYVHDPKKRRRNRAITILMHNAGFSNGLIANTLGINRTTVQCYICDYLAGGVKALLDVSRSKRRKADCADLKEATFRILHEPPRNHGINRSSWNLRELRATLISQGYPVGIQTLRTIIRDAGWKWKKAKIVLTSQDPDYSDKLAIIQTILRGLTPDEAFFSIDEFGPFSVKMKPGRLLAAPGQQPIVPQWQKSKGCMIMTAALELGSNQITHFYSQRKNTTEMIRMMNVLVEQYAERKTIYLSWDAASWHVSKKLFQAVSEHNDKASSLGRPVVETVPLPAGAQFLNVIEAVFSGMARAIIHNSNYSSVEETQEAINSYFHKRNQHFQEHPKKAGNKIWGNEKVVAEFSASNNCKDPRWR